MQSQNTTRFFDSKGNQVYVGKLVGSGGEGEVFLVNSPDSTLVAKIYKKPLGAEKQEKLRLLARGCNDDLKGIAAWPTDLLSREKDGPVCGFLMPKITGWEPVHKVYGPSHRKELYPDADWRFLVRAAKNLAAAFAVIHAYGYVIGDVNEGNILVSDTACVKLIDCDSFQVRAEGHDFYCEVGVAQFTPPEIQKSKDFRLLRTPNNDNFGLATLIFLLLFMGRHPFAGVYKGKEDMPIERAIAEYRFAFSRSAAMHRMAPPPDSVGLSIVPPEIATLFEQSFSEAGAQHDGRPMAHAWWDALNSLEKRLRICPTDSIHRYYSGLPSCPWCQLEQKSGVMLFLSADSASRIGISTEWRKLDHVKSPGKLPDISPKKYPVRPMPLNPAINKAFAFTKLRHTIGGVFIGLSMFVAYFPPFELFWAILIFLTGAVIGLFPGRESEELKRRKDRLRNAKLNWGLWNKKWIKEAGEEDFLSQSDELARIRKEYENLEQEYKDALSPLRGPVTKERQLAGHLDRCFIDNYQFIQIGANQRAALRSFGIETASDISLARLAAVTELNDAMKGELLLWREQMERAFVFDPSKGSGTDKTEIQTLLHKFQPRLSAREHELRQGLEKLCQIQQRIVNNRAKLHSHVEKSAKELAQAQADMTVFGTGLSRWF